MQLQIESQQPQSSTISLRNAEPELESREADSSEEEQSFRNSHGRPKPKQKKPAKEKQLICNVSDTKYPVVRLVTKKLMGWRLQRTPEADNWDIMWTDNAVQPEQLSRMQPHQKINHFPGMYSLSRKNYLGRNLMRMRKRFPDAYNFFPLTWMLPSEYGELRSYFEKDKKVKTVIVKPEASCQGRGIFLTRSLQDIEHGEHYVVQKYITKPLLIDSLKFDFRIYVLLAGCSPLRIYLFNEGLGRFATEKYVPPNKDNIDTVCMHLTNYAINKTNQNFVYNESEQQMDTGHKRSLTSVLRTLKQRGYDTDALWTRIKDIIIKTFISAQPVLAHHYKSCQPDNHANNMCFEVLGLDIMLDESFRPYLLEVNYTPSFSTDTPLDKLIKKNVIRDSLALMNITHKNKIEVINYNKETLMKRMLTGKKERASQQEKTELIRMAQAKRDEWEDQHLGGFEKIYPTNEGSAAYSEMLAYSQACYEDITGTNIKRNTKRETTNLVNLPAPAKKEKNEELQKIYKAKPPPNPFNKTVVAANSHNRRVNKSCIKMASTEAEQRPVEQFREKPTTAAQTYQSTRRQLLNPLRKMLSSEQQIQPIFKVAEKRDTGNYLRPRLFEINPNFSSSKEI